MRRLGLAVALFAIAFVARAQQPFEAVVSGYSSLCNAVPVPDFGVVQWFNPDRTDFGFSDPFAIAYDGLRVFGLQDFGTDLRILQLLPDGTEHLFVTIAGYEPTGITAAINGRVFVTAQQSGSDFLLVISPAGVLEATYPLTPVVLNPPRATIAVGSDGCTIYYANATGIARINGCTGAALPQYVTLGGTIRDIFPLANGNVLVAADGNVLLFDAAGTLLRTIPLISYGYSPAMVVGQVALNAEGTILWIAAASECSFDTAPGDSNELLRVAFSDGRELSREGLALNYPPGLVIGPAAATAIPTVGEWGLLLVTIAIAAAGALALRR